MIKLARATAIASMPDGKAIADSATVGSGSSEAAPMAVKWWLQMASVSSRAPRIFHWMPPRCRPTGNAIAPNSAPSAIDAVTNMGSHRMCPWTSKAAMPV